MPHLGSHTVARYMRSSIPSLFKASEDYWPLISYTIEEVVTRDCYGIFSRCRPIRAFLDIGANVGVTSHIARQVIESGGRIIAIEAVQDTATQLAINTQSAKVEVGFHGFGPDRYMYFEGEGVNPFLAHTCNRQTGQGAYCMSLPFILQQYDLMAQEDLFVKIDVEGAEACLLNHRESIKALAGIIERGGALGMEVHGGPSYYHPQFGESFGSIFLSDWRAAVDNKWLGDFHYEFTCLAGNPQNGPATITVSKRKP